jgi:hypothetical protein
LPCLALPQCEKFVIGLQLSHLDQRQMPPIIDHRV